MILLDSSVLIELFRAKEKSNTLFYKLAAIETEFAISVITHYEIYSGSNEKQDPFWNELLESIQIFDFNVATSETASKLYQSLKKANKMIDLADILIAATCLSNNLPIATLNLNHFERIENLIIVRL